MSASAFNEFIRHVFGNYFGFFFVCFMVYGLFYSIFRNMQERIPWLRRNDPNNNEENATPQILTEEELAMRQQQRRAAAKDGLAYRAGIPDISNTKDRLIIFEYFFQPRAMHPTKCCHLSHIVNKNNNNTKQLQTEEDNHGTSLVDQEEGMATTRTTTTPTVGDCNSSLCTKSPELVSSSSNSSGEATSTSNDTEKETERLPTATTGRTLSSTENDVEENDDDDDAKPESVTQIASSTVPAGNADEIDDTLDDDNDDDDGDYAEDACPICFNDYFLDGPGGDHETEENVDDIDDDDKSNRQQQQHTSTTMVMTGTNCNHVFHYNCFKQWVQMGNDHCPYCRKDMMTVGEFLDAARSALGDDRIEKLLQRRTLSSINEQQRSMMARQQQQR